jgi:hypothetical protein
MLEDGMLLKSGGLTSAGRGNSQRSKLRVELLSVLAIGELEVSTSA